MLAIGVGDVIDYTNKITVGVLLVVIVIGAYREWWVTGKQYHRVVAELDRLKEKLERRMNNVKE
jgi:hypothetical protein